MNRSQRRQAARSNHPSAQPVPTLGSPKAWFDQFPSLMDPDAWDNQQWCPRHWAPAALLGYQGMKASRILLSRYMSELCPSNLNSPRAINRHMASLGYICCLLGDDEMYLLWGQCAPARPQPD